MPWWMEFCTRWHKGQWVTSRTVWSTMSELELDTHWPWVIEGLMAERTL